MTRIQSPPLGSAAFPLPLPPTGTDRAKLAGWRGLRQARFDFGCQAGSDHQPSV